MFELENFRMGVNENGMHFQDSVTGVIFSVIEMTQETHKIAICSKSARKKVRDELMEFLQEQYKRCLTFEDISIEKVYIAPSVNFELYNFAMDSVGIKHKETGTLLGFSKVISGNVAEVGFCFDHVYGHDGKLCRDFFELCSSEIKGMNTGRYYADVFISKTWSEKTIQEKIYDSLEASIKNNLSYKNMYFYKEGNTITVKKDQDIILKLQIYDVTDEETWILNLKYSKKPVIKLFYCLMAMKRYPQIKNLIFRFEDKNSNPKRIVINRRNRTTILRDFVQIQNIDLEIE